MQRQRLTVAGCCSGRSSWHSISPIPHNRRFCIARLHANAVEEAALESQKRGRDAVQLEALAHASEQSSNNTLSRRTKLTLTAAAIVALICYESTDGPANAEDATAYATSNDAPSSAREYVSQNQGYRVSIPSAWDQKGKAGADVLWEDPTRRSTSVGITVNPVRVPSIEQFGTVDIVGTRLLDAEKKKESTISVALVSQSSRRSDVSGALLYDYEYELYSTRGRKRILNTVTIFNSKLYILNAAYKCGKTPEDVEGLSCPLESPEALDTLRSVASSFDVLKA